MSQTLILNAWSAAGSQRGFFLIRLMLFALGLIACSAVADAAPTGYADSAGVRIAYYETGSGPPLLLINGGPGFPARHFAPLASRLAHDLHMRVIRFDQRGTGMSRLPVRSAKTVTLALMVRDVQALRRKLGITRWTVMGHSFGGINAMAYAVYEPDAIDKLILSAPGGIDLTFVARLGANIQARLTDDERQQLEMLSKLPNPSYDDQLKTLSVTLDAYVTDKSQLPALRTAVVDSRVYVPAINTLVWRDLNSSHYDLATALAGLHVPTLIVQGDRDPLGLDTARQTQRAIIGATLVVVPDASHYMWLDNPTAYFSAIRNWVR